MSSEDPFNGFTLESTHLLEIVHNAFNKTFANASYLPAPRDIFHRTVSLIAMPVIQILILAYKMYDNIQTQRSMVARQAIDAVKMFLSEMEEEEIKEWVAWTRASRLGELVYKEPCPPGHSLVKGALNFKAGLSSLQITFEILTFFH